MEAVTDIRRLLSIAEAAKEFGMSERAARRAIEKGKFPVVVIDVGGKKKIVSTDIERFWDATEREAAS